MKKSNHPQVRSTDWLRTALYIGIAVVVVVAALFYFADIDPRNANQEVNALMQEIGTKLPTTKVLSKPLPQPTPVVGTSKNIQNVLPQKGKLTLSAIDVGQGDCLLLVTPDDKVMLIDGGEKSEFSVIQAFLDGAGIKKIDVLVATHPHSDHIGGLASVLKAYKVDKIYMPKVTHTTKTYENLLSTIQDQGKKITTAVAGKSIELGNEVNVKILHPDAKAYKDLNDYSVTLRIDYKDTSLLLTGDAGFDAEDAMLKSFADELDVDLIKVAHHGSSENSSSQFLNKVNPGQAIICVGEDNSYNHPSPKVLERLEHKNAQIYRTNIFGTISAYSDGTQIRITSER